MGTDFLSYVANLTNKRIGLAVTGNQSPGLRLQATPQGPEVVLGVSWAFRAQPVGLPVGTGTHRGTHRGISWRDSRETPGTPHSPHHQQMDS